jgi:hypothetical protein
MLMIRPVIIARLADDAERSLHEIRAAANRTSFFFVVHCHCH